MGSPLRLEFKLATSEEEFKQIHQLNYRTFVEEIPQHSPNNNGELVDPFHDENAYIICKRGRKLLGMIAIRGKRPFSLDRKLPNLDEYLPRNNSVCEIRLLSVNKGHRSGLILSGMLERLYVYVEEHGYDLALISGVLRQLKLYQHIGFIPFGPRVGKDEALFQPMYITKETFAKRARGFLRRATGHPSTSVNLLPGPVTLRGEVLSRFALPPISHRSAEFQRHLEETKTMLCALTKASNVELLTGSGTLGNDAVAAQLKLHGSKGLVLSNGEFGERLINHAHRFGLEFDTLSLPWGTSFSATQISSALDAAGKVGWLWATHCETSSGVLNDLELLQAITQERSIDLCLDCVSSLATVPVNLSKVALASSSSGKALGGLPGLSMVFYNIPLQSGQIPRYLDLGYYQQCSGIPFTTSSNLLGALHEALRALDSNQRFTEVRRLSAFVRTQLERLDLPLIGKPEDCSPAVITICLPPQLSVITVGEKLDFHGFMLSYRSQYLVERNWLQICLMGQLSRPEIAPLFPLLRSIINDHHVLSTSVKKNEESPLLLGPTDLASSVEGTIH